MKKAITIALILMISILLVACSRKPEIKVNETVTEGLPEDESSAPIIQPEIQPEDNLAGNDDAMNATPANNTETEIISEPEEPEIILEEEPLRPTDDECIADFVESCNGPPKLNCTEKAVFQPDKKTLTLFAKNNFGKDISLNYLERYNEEEPWFCMTRLEVESVDVSIDGSGLVNIDTHPKLNDGEIIKFVITYSGADKGYIDQKFALGYTMNTTYESYFLISALKN